MLATAVLLLAILPAVALEIHPDNPHYFIHDGRTVVLVGCSDRAALFIWQNAKGFGWRDYLRDIASAGLNYVRQDVCAWSSLDAPNDYPAQLSSPAWPFLRNGPGDAVDGRPRFDLTKLDPDYLAQRLRPFLEEARRLGVFVELTLFDQLNGRSFPLSLFADENNVNGLGLGPGDGLWGAAPESDSLWAIQRSYVSAVVDATRDYDHVIYEVANEAGAAEWVAAVVDLLHELRPDALVSAGEQTSSYDVLGGENDIVVKHRGTGGPYATDEDVARHHDSLLDFRRGKPVIHNEFFLYANRSTDDPNFVRKMIWGDVLAGGHTNFFDFAFWRGTGRTVDDGEPSRTPPDTIIRAGGILLEFLERHGIDLAQLEPADDRVRPDSGIAFAMGGEPGSLAYLCGATEAELLSPGPQAVLLDPLSGAEHEVAFGGPVDEWRRVELPAGWQEVAIWVPGA
jgi:hypothetical protein